MSACIYHKYFGEYINGELPFALEIDFIRHFDTCKKCRDAIDEFYETHRLLTQTDRPLPPSGLIDEYKNNIVVTFGQDRFLGIVRTKILNSRLQRSLTIMLLIIVSILTLRYFLTNDSASENTIALPSATWQQPVAQSDIDYIGYYLVASEMILLEMVNVPLANPELFIKSETAQKFLMKTFLIHETALKLNDPQLLRFLSKMELILIELSNIDSDQVQDSIVAVRMVIKNARLLDEVKQLQKVFESEQRG